MLRASFALCALMYAGLTTGVGRAQGLGAPGHSIGTVSTRGDLVVVTLDTAALTPANLFNLTGRTLRFVPERGGYRVENGPLHWDADFGSPLAGAEVTLHGFTFPFSGTRWTSFLVGTTGSIRFGASAADVRPDAYGHPEGGVALGRFDPLAESATNLVDSVTAICVFLKPRLSGPRYVKELPDRAVITWDLTEPFGGLLDFSWAPTVNRFQAVLHRDGTVEMSYQALAARDAIVGLYPRLPGVETPLGAISGATHPTLPPHLDVQSVQLSSVDGVRLRVRVVARGPMPAPGTPAVDGTGYRVVFDATPDRSGSKHSATWVIQGMRDPYNPNGGPPDYHVSGPGVSPNVRVSEDTITIEGVLPQTLRGAAHVAVSAEAIAGPDGHVVTQLPQRTVSFRAIRSAEVHFTALERDAGPFPIVYEAFHYAASPRPQDLACTIIQALGDWFDFLVYFSDFRIDSQEASSPSFGPAASDVKGIGQTSNDPATYCSAGRLQWALAQPIAVDANETQEQPPADAPAPTARDLAFWQRQRAAASADGKPRPYDYAMSNIGHEMAHRWAAYVAAKVGSETIPLGPWPHWDPGLQTQVAFPYEEPIEASTLGGGVWQDNGDSTYTRLRDGYFVPATGYSYLDLYLMGFLSAAEVPDFFLLRNRVPTGTDVYGRPIFRAERTRITIGDVISAAGPRVPDAAHSQRLFNTGIVLVVMHGQQPSATLVRRADGIRRQWIEYWGTVTGHRASMTVRAR